MQDVRPMVLTEASLAALTPGAPLVQPGGAVALVDGRVLWSGPEEALPPAFRAWEMVGVGGRLVTPALIDCHTHLVHAGHRAAEFEARLNGASYEEIAQAGGGILSTVRATRCASGDQLLAAALRRLDALLAEGVGTVEVKSGYGLDRDAEIRMLRAARALARERRVEVRTTFLGAHAIPPEYRGRARAYLEEVCLPTLREAHAEGLVDAVDAFCETVAFSPSDVERLFGEAHALGLPVKLHAEQLSHQGGAALAARHGALSADHLEYATEADAAAMAAAGTVAVLLPGAFYTLRETRRPPVAAFRAQGTPMAVATDCNPGTSPISSILMAMNMACVLYGLTVPEALAGVTREAARALGLKDRGTLAPGMRADIAIWDAEAPAELCYRLGDRQLHARLHAGEWC